MKFKEFEELPTSGFERAYRAYNVLTKDTFCLIIQSNKLEQLQKKIQSEKDLILIFTERFLKEDKGFKFYANTIENIKESLLTLKKLEEEEKGLSETIKKLTDDNI